MATRIPPIELPHEVDVVSAGRPHRESRPPPTPLNTVTVFTSRTACSAIYVGDIAEVN